MENHKKVSKAAGAVGSMTLVSRLFGFVRDLVLAMTFGASASADAFFVAFRIPNIQRRILGEGAVSAAMIPVYGEYLNTKNEEETQNFASNLFNIQFTVLVITSFAIVTFAPFLIMAFAPGFLDEPDKFELTVTLTRWMGPYLILVGMSAFCMGILNTHGIFKPSAAAPILVNVCMVLGALILSPYLEQPIMGLAIGVLVGGLLQFLVQFPITLRNGLKLSSHFNWKHPGILKVGKLLGPAILGFGVYEINLLVDTLLASLLAGGSVSYLYYANRMVQLPLGVFGVALGVAILPMLTGQAARQEIEEFRDTLAFGIRLILFITVPATVGLIILSFPIINTLWERGEFVRTTTEGTSLALIYYSVGLCAFAGTKVLVSAFYSLQDTKTPMKIGIYSMLLNVTLAIILMGPLKHGGIALATSLSAIFNAGALVFLLKKRLGRMGGRRIVSSMIQLTIAVTLMGLGVYFANAWWFDPETPLIHRIGILFGEIALGVIIYTCASWLMKNEELKFIHQLIREKRGLPSA
jgi:putative peptidoglycan lipid II flippase